MSGFVAILLVYIWCNEVWVPAYGVADYGDTSRHPPYLFQLHWQSAVYGVIALAAGHRLQEAVCVGVGRWSTTARAFRCTSRS